MTTWQRLSAVLYDPFFWLAERAGLAARRRALVRQARGHVLEIGAGTGLNLRHYADDAELVLSEPDAAMADRLRRRVAGRERPATVVLASAEALPFADGEFDTVMSCLGVMFAPYHQASADELIRVCRPGGTIGLLNWTPEGFIGQMFATMKPYAPPPPPGAQPPPLWGREEHVRALLGDQVTDVTARRRALRVSRFGRPEDFRDYFKANYGPTIAVYRAIANDPDKVEALDEALAELGRRHDLGGGAMEWEYLLVTALRT